MDPKRFEKDLFNRAAGCLVGLAVGDALGTTLEFTDRNSLTPIDDIVGGGPFGLAPGQWTDDTSMALCLAESLIENGSFNLHDQITRYVRWFRTGHLSSTGSCFDIGTTISDALIRFESDGEPTAGSTDPESCGNGSLMRLAPVPIRYYCDPAKAIERSGESSRTTHQSPCAVDACRYFGGLLTGAINGASKETLLSGRSCPIEGYWCRNRLEERIDAIAAGSFINKSSDEIRTSGYVVHTLEAALWAFSRTDNFRDALLTVVNLGGDADTTGAVCGQIAGAYYGLEAIPPAWRDKLTMYERIRDFARCLLELK